MAYGQTGTGKTHTIVKDILPQTIDYLTKFAEKSDCGLYFSACQVYNETVSDLVSHLKELEVRERKDGFFVEGLEERKVESSSDVNKLVTITEGNRKKGVTSLNVNSSRSHAVYTFRLVQRSKHTSSVLNLVDLAGSERHDKSKIKNEQKKESISINASLTALSRCILFMTNKKKAHVPFRDSKLTKILVNSLSGNSKTCLVVTLSPSINDLDETIASLNFGQRACKVKLKPKINDNSGKVDRDYLDGLVRELKEKDRLLEEKNGEIAELKKHIDGCLNRPFDYKQTT